jgi:adenine phosphoribosyltransferase
MSETEFYIVNIAGVERQLRKMEVAPGVKIAVLNILGDTELVQAAAKALAQKLPPETDYIVTAEAKSIPLAYAVSVESKLPYIVLRKSQKPYMGDVLTAETLSITTNKPQTLFLDEKDRETIKDKNVILLDDVISTGSTLQGMRLLMGKVGAKVIGEAAILTEGDRAKWQNIISLGHLPVFTG